jgi:hypothetical protein
VSSKSKVIKKEVKRETNSKSKKEEEDEFEEGEVVEKPELYPIVVQVALSSLLGDEKFKVNIGYSFTETKNFIELV